MGKITETELLTYCGLYCGACPIKNGQIRDTAKSLQALLSACNYPEWAPTMADFVPATRHYSEFEEVLAWLTTQDCSGCLAGGGDPQCAIRVCAKEKGLPGCWECAELNCERLQRIDQGASVAPENRQRIREVGLEAWLAEQATQVETGFSYLGVFGGDE